LRDHIASPQPRVATYFLLELSIDPPQRRIAVNLFPELGVAVDFARHAVLGLGKLPILTST